MKLKGKRAVVTGSSSGIGRDIALLLAAEGAQVVVNARGSGSTGTAAIDTVVDEIRVKGGTAIGVAGSVDDADFARELIEQCVSNFGGIDILINNAAILSAEALGPVDKCPLDIWEKTLRVNLSGPFYTSRAALPHMVKQKWGRIINASSDAGTGAIGGSAYASAKSGLFGFSRAMAADYGPYGITVNVYTPEALTPMTTSAGPDFFGMVLKHWQGRGYKTQAQIDYLTGLGGPQGVAPWVAYLSTDEAAYLNGRTFALESRRIAMTALPDEERVLFRDFAHSGPWSLDELSTLAPLAFPVVNAWPPRSGEDLRQWEKA